MIVATLSIFGAQMFRPQTSVGIQGVDQQSLIPAWAHEPLVITPRALSVVT